MRGPLKLSFKNCGLGFGVYGCVGSSMDTCAQSDGIENGRLRARGVKNVLGRRIQV